MTRSVALGLVVLAAMFVLRAEPAEAQVPVTVPGRIELAVAGQWTGRAGLGASDANEVTGAGAPYRLFSTVSALDAGVGGELRLGVRVMRLVQLEASGGVGRHDLSSAISNDVEGAAAVTARESVEQFTIEGRANMFLPSLRLPRQGVAYAAIGGGYLRQRHEGATLVETGRTARVGGGVRWMLRTRPGARMNGVGARIEGALILRSGGVAFDGGAHLSPALSAGLFARF